MVALLVSRHPSTCTTQHGMLIMWRNGVGRSRWAAQICTTVFANEQTEPLSACKRGSDCVCLSSHPRCGHAGGTRVSLACSCVCVSVAQRGTNCSALVQSATLRHIRFVCASAPLVLSHQPHRQSRPRRVDTGAGFLAHCTTKQFLPRTAREKCARRAPHTHAAPPYSRAAETGTAHACIMPDAPPARGSGPAGGPAGLAFWAVTPASYHAPTRGPAPTAPCLLRGSRAGSMTRWRDAARTASRIPA